MPSFANNEAETRNENEEQQEFDFAKVQGNTNKSTPTTAQNTHFQVSPPGAKTSSNHKSDINRNGQQQNPNRGNKPVPKRHNEFESNQIKSKRPTLPAAPRPGINSQRQPMQEI